VVSIKKMTSAEARETVSPSINHCRTCSKNTTGGQMLMTHGRQCDLQELVDWSTVLEVSLFAECLWVSARESIPVVRVESNIM
jgi:hypothetical protein